jgi:tetratricopeptide (TPR) repeat protein
MTPVVFQTDLYAMPDLHGWFSPMLRLTESIAVAPEGMQIMERTNRRVALDDAITRSNQLIQQFEQAKQAGGNDFELLTTYLLPALEALAEVGAEQRLRDLTSRFEGLLSQINVIDQPETATSLLRLGTLYLNQGRYAESEPLLKKALAIREAQLGPDHPSTGTSLNNLAGLYYAIDRLPEAAQMLSGVVAILEKALGAEHPNTITVKNNLAIIQQAIDQKKNRKP